MCSSYALASAQFPADWVGGRRAPIALNHALVTADQSNFPWIIQASAFPSEFWTNVQADGGDIRFTSDETGAIPLHSEITNFNKTGHTITAYVKIPNISSSVDTTIWVWYKSSVTAAMPAASNPTWGSQGVWDANYTAVYHMDGASGANESDSTANGHNMTDAGAVTSVAGKIDNGRSGFTGSVSLYNAALAEPGTYTIETWANILSTSGGYQCIFSNLQNNHAQFRTFVANQNIRTDIMANNLNYNVYTTSSNPISSAPAAYHLAVASDGTAGNSGMAIYVDGSSLAVTAGPFGTPAYPGSGWGWATIGEDSASSTFPAPSWIDEVRFSNIVRSADWITTSYNNQANLAISGTPGTPEDVPGGAVPEFSSWAMIVALGLVVVGMTGMRKRRSK